MVTKLQRQRLGSLLDSLSTPEELPMNSLRVFMLDAVDNLRREMINNQSGLSQRHNNFLSNLSLLESKTSKLIDTNRELTDKSLEDLKNELSDSLDVLKEKIRNAKRGGGSMYQAWQMDSSYDGTLAGTLNGSNVIFTLRATPKANSLLWLYNGVVGTPVSDFALSQRTVTASLAPISSDTLTAIYPI